MIKTTAVFPLIEQTPLEDTNPHTTCYFTSSSAAILSSSLSSLSPEARVGGVDAGRGFSDTALRSFT